MTTAEVSADDISLVNLGTDPFVVYRHNTVIDSPPGGNGNGCFEANERGEIVMTLENLAQDAQGVTAKLCSGDNLLTITDSTAVFGDILSGATASNDADRFAASVGATVPPGTMAPCTLHVQSSNWSHEWTYIFMITLGEVIPAGRFMATLDTGAVALDVCGIGSLGVVEPNGAGGGFQVPKGAVSSIFFSSIMAGKSPDYVVDHFYGRPTSPSNKDWVMADSFRMVIPPAPADQQWVNTMTDGGHPDPQSLSLEQHWYMNSDPGYDDFAVVTLDFTNEGSQDINGLYVGLVADFDIGPSTTSNMVGSDEIRRAVWMRSSEDDDPTVGFAVLDPHQFANLTAIDHRWYVFPDTAMSEAVKWRLLSGGIASRQSNRNYDWSCLASAGPFNLPMGGKHRIGFAVVGATSHALFGAAVDSAQSWYDGNGLGISQEQTPRVVAGERALLLSPNPFSRGTVVHYSCPAAGQVELSAYDAGGRQVEHIVFSAEKGRGQYFWQPKELASGVYFLKVRTQESESAAKVLLLD